VTWHRVGGRVDREQGSGVEVVIQCAAHLVETFDVRPVNEERHVARRDCARDNIRHATPSPRDSDGQAGEPHRGRFRTTNQFVHEDEVAQNLPSSPIKSDEPTCIQC